MNVLLIGTGEYTVGIPPNPSSSSNQSDKKLGVVALTMLDLKRRGKVRWVGLCGTSREKVVRSQEWLHNGIGQFYSNIPTHLDALWPIEDGIDRTSYKKAIDALPSKSAVTIFTPDSTHFDIASYAIDKGMHVMLAKPATLSLEHHKILAAKAQEKGVLVCVEFHKRFDPIYLDAKEQISTGQAGIDFNYFYAYMSQPKYQLETFKSWAGKDSDISYYLNSHHIDFLAWSLRILDYQPVKVVSMASRGIASNPPFNCDPTTEDTITLTVTFQNRKDHSKTGVAVFTASWTAPNKAECHSQQRFHYMGDKSEIRIDQAHRGYELTSDERGYTSKNPLFMKYTPSSSGAFVGQLAYGYVSFDVWIDACAAMNNGKISVDAASGFVDVNGKEEINDLVGYQYQTLATIQSTITVTQILEAARKSLDNGSAVQLLKHK